MSSTHTPGRLIAIPNQMRDDGQHFLCRDVEPQPYPGGGGAFPGEPPRMQLPPAICGMGMPEADARRLAACWNHAIGIETDALDGGGVAPLTTILAGVTVQDELLQAMRARLQAAIDALAKTETYLLERLSSNPGSTGATVILPLIRRAIEGAGVAPTQSTWGDFPAT